MTSLWRVTVRTPRERAEEAAPLFVALAPQGFEERDVEDGVELAVFVDGDTLETMRARLPGATVEPVEAGWEDAWRAFHRPVEVAGIWIGPPWEAPPDPSRAVVIDPGRAFGTGAHATTRLCVELLASSGAAGRCSTSAAARASSGSPRRAPRLPPDHLRRRRSGGGRDDRRERRRQRRRARRTGSSTRSPEPLPAADVAVANVLLDPVEAILGRLDAEVAITSGYLAGERPAHAGWRHRETVVLDGWAADRFERGATATA